MRRGWNIADATKWAIAWTFINLYYTNQIMKEFDRLMFINGSSVSEPSLCPKQLSDNDDKSDLQEVLVSEACFFFFECLEWGFIC